MRNAAALSCVLLRLFCELLVFVMIFYRYSRNLKKVCAILICMDKKVYQSESILFGFDMQSGGVSICEL